ncbi:MAG: hypothetical protein M1820_001616 [Bogoriella megaspora]|nr:MAG: hypothetical protein M1820_001616 [Bogoriella megaspora]
MATVVEAVTPPLTHWTFPRASGSSGRSSMVSKDTRDADKAPAELKQQFGLGAKQDSESLLNQQYLSDEEGLSPIENDDTLSIDDDSDDFDEIEFADDLPELATTFEYTAKACTEALVISIKLVKPKVVEVSIPSPTEKSPPRGCVGPEPNTESKSTEHKDTPIEQVSTFDAVRRRSLSSVQSRPESRRYSFAPLMESAAEARAMSAMFLPSGRSSANPSFLETDPFASAPAPARSPSTTQSRLRSLSKTISIAKLSSKKANDAAQSPTTPRTPVKSPTNLRMKLVPRGAGEREPILQLPDFPESENDTAPDVSRTKQQWPARTDSKEKLSKLRRRKSLVFG